MKQSEKSNETNSNFGNISQFEQLESHSRNIFESAIDSLKLGIQTIRDKTSELKVSGVNTKEFNSKLLSSSSLLFLAYLLNSAPVFAEQPKGLTDKFDAIKTEILSKEGGYEYFKGKDLGSAIISAFYRGDVDSNGNFKEGTIRRIFKEQHENTWSFPSTESDISRDVEKFKLDHVQLIKDDFCEIKCNDLYVFEKMFYQLHMSFEDNEYFGIETTFWKKALKVQSEHEESQRKIQEQVQNNEMIIKVLSSLAVGGGLVGSYLILKKRY